MTVTRYERNPIARQKCLDRYGYSCIVCKFNFDETFGELGRGYIQVHHINPISEIAGPYEIDPEKDLVPICPNCHAMLHARRPGFSVEELKAMMR